VRAFDLSAEADEGDLAHDSNSKNPFASSEVEMRRAACLDFARHERSWG
jgi:hypothetical protein